MSQQESAVSLDRQEKEAEVKASHEIRAVLLSVVTCHCIGRPTT